MKKLLTIISIITLSLLLVSLTGCSIKYRSHYSALLLVRVEERKSSTMRFTEFKGTKVFKMKAQSGEKLVYSASLDNGSAKVYYDNEGEKTELFTINSNENVSNELLNLKSGVLYIIVETSEKCSKGEFIFNIVE